tara:strand:+ start:8460 stop:14192 length:5733 start_codon:yes stop_codon:yes gene_type:complete
MAQERITLAISAVDQDLQKVLQRSRRSLESFASGSEKAANRTKKAFRGLDKEAATSVERIRAGILNLRYALLTLGGGAVLGSITKFSTEFQTALSEVGTLLDKNAISLDRYEQQLIRLSRGSSKDLIDLTKGLYQVISAGIPQIEGTGGAMDLLNQAQKAATAGVTDTKTAVDALVTVVNSYGAAVVNPEKASDVLFQTVKLGRTTFAELGKAIGRVAPIAAKFGVGIEDLSAMLIQLTRNGLNTNEAVTALRNLIRSLAKPSKQSRQLLERLADVTGRTDLAMTATSLKTKGLAETMRILSDATGGNVDVLARLFPNIRAMLPAVVSIGTGFEEFSDILGQAKNNTGAAAEALKEFQGDVEYTWKLTKNNLNASLIELGQRVFPLLISRIQQFDKFIKTNGDQVANFAKGAVDAFDAIITGMVKVGQLFSRIPFLKEALLGGLLVKSVLLLKAGVASMAASVTANLGVVGTAFSGMAAAITTQMTTLQTSVAAQGTLMGRIFGSSMAESMAASVPKLAAGLGSVMRALPALAGVYIVGQLVAQGLVDGIMNGIMGKEAELQAALGKATKRAQLAAQQTASRFGFKDTGEAEGARQAEGAGKLVQINDRLIAQAGLQNELALKLNKISFDELELSNAKARADFVWAEAAKEREGTNRKALAVSRAQELEQQVRNKGYIAHHVSIIDFLKLETLALEKQGMTQAKADAKAFESLRKIVHAEWARRQAQNESYAAAAKADAASLKAAQEGLDALKNSKAAREENSLVLDQIVKAEERLVQLRDKQQQSAAKLRQEDRGAETLRLDFQRLETQRRIAKVREEQAKVAQRALDAFNKRKQSERRVESILLQLARERAKLLKELNKLQADAIKLDLKQVKLKQKLHEETEAGKGSSFSPVAFSTLTTDDGGTGTGPKALQKASPTVTADGLVPGAVTSVPISAEDLTSSEKLLKSWGVTYESSVLNRFQETLRLQNNAREKLKGYANSEKSLGDSELDSANKRVKLIEEEVRLQEKLMQQAEQAAATNAAEAKRQAVAQLNARKAAVQNTDGTKKKSVKQSAHDEVVRKATENYEQTISNIDKAQAKAIAKSQQAFGKFLSDTYPRLTKAVALASKATKEFAEDADLLEGLDREFVRGADGLEHLRRVAKSTFGELGKLITPGADASFVRWGSTTVDALNHAAKSLLGFGDLVIKTEKVDGKLTDVQRTQTWGEAWGRWTDHVSKQWTNWTKVFGKGEKAIRKGEQNFELLASSLGDIGVPLRETGDALLSFAKVIGTVADFNRSQVMPSITGIIGSILKLGIAVGKVGVKALTAMLRPMKGLAEGSKDLAKDLSTLGAESLALATKGVAAGGMDMGAGAAKSLEAVNKRASEIMKNFTDKGLIKPLKEFQKVAGRALGFIGKQFAKTFGAEKVYDVLSKTIGDNTTKVIEAIGPLFDIPAQVLSQATAKIIMPAFDAVSSGLNQFFGSMTEAVGALLDYSNTKAAFAEARRDLNKNHQQELQNLVMSGASVQQLAGSVDSHNAAIRKLEQEEIDAQPMNILTKKVQESLEVIDQIVAQLPMLVEGFINIVITEIPGIIEKLAGALVEIIPIFAEALPELMTRIISALIEALPALIDALIQAVPFIIQAIVEGLVLIVEALPELVEDFLESLITMLPILFEKLAESIPKLITAIIEAVPRIIISFLQKLPKIISAIIEGIPKIISGIIKALPDIIKELVKALPELIWELIKLLPILVWEMARALGKALWDIVKSIANAFNPSSWFHDGGMVRSSMASNRGGTAKLFSAMGAKKYALGGMVGAAATSAMSDNVPAILQAGEAVLSRRGVSAVGGESAVSTLNQGLSIEPQAQTSGDVTVNLSIGADDDGLGNVVSAILPSLMGSVTAEIDSPVSAIRQSLDSSAAALGLKPVKGRK